MDDEEEAEETEVTYIEEEGPPPPRPAPPLQVISVPSRTPAPDNTLLWMGSAAAAGALAWLLWPRHAAAAPPPPNAPTRPTAPTGPSAPGEPAAPDDPTVAPPPPPPASDDPIFSEVDFPPLEVGQQYERLDRLASRAEETSGIGGLRDYLIAVASGESAYTPSAMNTKTDGPGAFRLLCYSQNFGGRYKNNPWRPAACKSSDPMAPRWSYSGGWFQMMPATALSTGDQVGYNMDPASVFVPARAVAFATDLVADFVKNWGADTFADVRAGWALPKWAKATNTSEGKAKRVKTFKERLLKLAGKGVDPHLWKKKIDIGSYPGFQALVLDLIAFDEEG